MQYPNNAVSWVEIPVVDFPRAKQFYSTIFSYEMHEMPMGGNLMGFLFYDPEKGGVGGAIIKGEGAVPSAEGSTVYLNGGDDLSVVLDKVEGAGGKIIVPKTDIGDGMGFFAIFLDVEGNKVGLHSNS